MKTLVDFCQTLVKIKPDVNHHQKLEYTLTAINIFYPNYPKEKATYISLGPETIKSIKQHLNQLSTKSQQFKMLKVSDTEKPSNENVNQRFNQVQRQIKEIEEIYPDEIKRICDLILRIRKGTLQKNAIDELLTDASKQILQEHTDTTSEPIMSSMKTKDLINDSSQQGVDNLNSEELPTNITDNTPIHLQKLKVKDDQKVDSCPNNDTIKIDSIISNPSEENTTRPSDHAEDSSKPSKLLTSSTSEVASSLNESSETVSQSLNSQTKNDVHLTEEQCSHIQLESSQRTEEQFSDSACQLNSSSFKQTNNTQDKDNISKPSVLSIQNDTSQTEKLFTGIQKSCSVSNPPQSSIIEVILPLSYQPKDAAKQSKSSMLPPLPTLTTSRRNEKNLTNTAESPNEFKLPKLSTSGSTSPFNESLNHRENRIQSPSSSSPSNLENTLATRTHCSDPKSNNDYINVLLLGESGVGKSTFINALVNYITFESFEKASCTKPVVVMPVSFMMTVGHHFEEKIVTFGDEDSNEDHHHPGQSVTQHCRSYIFPIGTRTKIRFIDTPGMGDTRGLIQDDINMQHILSFITNLSHLNAICILLKPNESRLNIVLRSYFDRLLKFLGENARHNIIFCFTNTRATFFAPGDTAPLLKKMILSCPIKDIPFDKSNTFCFDSESFRYLVAVRSGIEFDQYQKNEYQQSWTISVTESDRLLQYFCGSTLKPYLQNEWRSVEHAQFRISQLIRPMLETTRNLFRNLLLLERHQPIRLINLCPMALRRSSAICYSCERIRTSYSNFWIFQDDLHIVSDQCDKCKCARQNHVEVDYDLQYELSNDMERQSSPNMNESAEQLKITIIEFAQLYANSKSISSQTDPILFALKRMIAEEKQFCCENDSTCLNPFLYDKLRNFREEYKQAQETSILTDSSIDLSNIYESIENISTIYEIEKQMSLIKQKKESFMITHERELS
ncbi:unnamed protein product [Rotaria sp. Silwood1]|nr:unnamed protein product [Rotaria sp. Silwood1]